MVVATPLALNTTVVDPSVPALAVSVAVWPFTLVEALVHGLLVSAQAVTVAEVDWQLMLAPGSDSS